MRTTFRMRIVYRDREDTALSGFGKNLSCGLATSECFVYQRAPSLGHGFGLVEIPTGASRPPVSCSAE